jgi:flagellar hook-basal body complex protein FliE
MAIDPISINNVSLAQVTAPGRIAASGGALPTNVFDDVLSKAASALETVSQTEFTANNLINNYIQGKAELSDVMVATSKMNISVQLAVTVITSAVSSFKEITQMQM